MNKMNQLKDLLKHELHDLHSAEEQIIEALPKMIDKANDSKLKKSLEDHLIITEVQKERLDQVLMSMKEEGEKKGFLSGLLGAKKCKGMQGLIAEGEKMMSEDMDPDVMDAAIVACAQKIEHYEISGYGTARAFAEELGLRDVAKVLTQTLDEEYEADDLLTQLAESRLNKEAISRKSNRSERSTTEARRPASSRRSQTSSGKTRVNRSATAKKKTAGKSSGPSSRKKTITRK